MTCSLRSTLQASRGLAPRLVGLICLLVVAVNCPNEVKAEFLTFAGQQTLSDSGRDLGSFGAAQTQEESTPSAPSKTPDPQQQVEQPRADFWLALAGSSGGMSGSGAASPGTGSGHLAAAMPTGQCIPELDAAGRLFLPGILFPPLPLPLELLDPPRA